MKVRSQLTFEVSPDGVPAERTYRSIGEAVRAAEAAVAAARSSGAEEPETRVIIAAGEYREKLRIQTGGLRLEGAGAEVTRLVWNDSAKTLLADGQPMGTFNSYTLYVGAPGVSVSGITVENDAGDGRVVGQAVALYADADRLSFTECRFLGRQDTICTGPLPKNPVPTGINLTHPVAGLGDDIPSLPFRQHFRACLITGDVDFIFGSALAVFEDCEIRSRPRGGEPTYIAAPSTYPGQEAGFVFSCCRLTAEKGDHGSVYLCRPWRATGRCVYLKCELGGHIDKAGWDDWGKAEAHDTGFFAEFRPTGPGAENPRRPAWVRPLRPGEAARFSPGKLLI